MRTIKRTWKSEKVNMGGIILDQPLPTRSTEQIDPFLLVHHWNDTLSGGKTQKDSGVGPHPHRGFTPVTFIFQGGVHHRDTRGGDSIINAGGTQWMNAGRGIVHSERPRKDLAEEGGNFELIQFWVNAPASQKMIEPSYQPLTKEDTPWLEAPDGLSKVGLVAGELEGQKGKVQAGFPEKEKAQGPQTTQGGTRARANEFARLAGRAPRAQHFASGLFEQGRRKIAKRCTESV